MLAVGTLPLAILQEGGTRVKKPFEVWYDPMGEVTQ